MMVALLSGCGDTSSGTTYSVDPNSTMQIPKDENTTVEDMTGSVSITVNGDYYDVSGNSTGGDIIIGDGNGNGSDNGGDGAGNDIDNTVDNSQDDHSVDNTDNSSVVDDHSSVIWYYNGGCCSCGEECETTEPEPVTITGQPECDPSVALPQGWCYEVSGG